MTAQIRDRILFEGRIMDVLSPVPLPRRRKRVKKVTDWTGSEYPLGPTTCWRGYVALWWITDSKLYLLRIHGAYRIVGNEPLHATWFTGTLHLNDREITVYEHLRYVTRFAPETILAIERGMVVGKSLL